MVVEPVAVASNAAGLRQAGRHADHPRDEVARPGPIRRTEDAERVEVPEEVTLLATGERPPGDAEQGGASVDLLLEVRDVHHVLDGDPVRREGAPNEVEVEVRARVSDVRRCVDGRTADVHANRAARRVADRYDALRQGVPDAQRHRVGRSGVGRP